MKLKRVLSGLLVGAMVFTGIPTVGPNLAGPVNVYAEEVDGVGDAEKYPDILLDMEAADVTTSGVDSEQQNVSGSNVLTEDENKWVSPDVTNRIPQWIQIDLHEQRTSVDKIQLVFGDEIWAQSYEISTFDSVVNSQHHIVKNVGSSGPDTTVGEEAESRDSNTKTDTIYRNQAENPEKIILRRYVRFTFQQSGNDTGKKVSLKKIRIFGTGAGEIHGPSIKVTAPVAGAYPQIAEVLASSDDQAKYHQDLADRTNPAATLIKTDLNASDLANPPDVTEITDDMLLKTQGTDFTVDSVDDGYAGFNAVARTPGKVNKFDIAGEDMKIISFQVYLNKMARGDDGGTGQTVSFFGKGNKYALQLGSTNLQLFMHAGGNSWPTDIYTVADPTEYNADSNPDGFLKRWHDILVVVDGKGRQRLYVDGEASTKRGGDNATADANAAEGSALEKGEKHFTIGYNEADNQVKNQAFTSDYGYMARLKFYTDKAFAGMINGAGVDISGAQVLSQEAVDLIDIAELETAAGYDLSNKEATKAKKNDVYPVIMNQLQKERATLRITLCPYNRHTVWQKYEDNTWKDMEAAEKFADNLSGKKYRAVTTLRADDGFIFHDDCRTNVKTNLDAGDENAQVIVNIKSGTKHREMEVVTYYGCESAEDPAIPDSECQIEDLIVAQDSVSVEYAKDKVVEIGAAHAHIEQLCKKHQNAAAKITYAVASGSEEYITIEDAEQPKVKLVKSNKGILGHNTAKVVVTAALQDNGSTVTDADGEEIKVSKTVEIRMENPKSEDQVIEVAPVITAQAPVAGNFPQVVDIAIPKEAKHFTDIADRMNPAAFLEPLTQDYIRTSQYVKEGTKTGGSRPKDPTEEWISGWNNTPVVKNVDGVWAFNAQGQTPGDTNKFDVFGRDIKLVSFKLYLKKWPEVDPTQNNGNPTAIDIYGKGNKYAFQATSDRTLFMFMEAENGSWPTEIFTPDNAEEFLGKWHNVFMVVDGKGWQRLYVDGKPSRSRGTQGTAYAAETTGYARKPFTLGYNSKSNNPNWYTGMFTEEYGYIADFEFYSNKNYDNIINGSGTDISEAAVLKPEQAEIINLSDLETEKYKDNPEVIGTILTNLLQENNAAACITATPYVAKTNWSQKTEDGSFENLDKINAKAFGFSSSYRSVTTLTAYDGFKFKSDKSFTDAVAANFKTAGSAQAKEVTVTVGANAQNEADKVLTITAVYDETEEAPCTCEIDIVTPPAPVSITIPESAATGEGTLAETTEDDVVIECLKEEHPLQGRVLFTYGVKEGDEDKIDFDLTTRKITAKKAGTAKITLTAAFQTQNESGAWETYLNDDEEEVTVTEEITVTITKEGAASQAEKSELSDAANDAKEDYPASLESDYEAEAWQALQTAIAEAEELAANPNATSAEVAAAKQKITDAIADLADHKSAKGKAKDALKGVLESMKAEYDANNSDKKYTDASWKAFADAYKAAMDELATADAARLGALKTALETAKKNLVAAGGPGGPGTPGTPETEVKDGQVLTGPDGTYQVASAKDKTVVITKGKDAKNLKVQSVVTINKVTYKVVGIGSKAFANCKKARKITIGDNVTSIGANAFSGCSKATQLTLGKSVKSIGKKAFYNCKKLKKVTIKGKALSTIGKQAFQKTAKKVTVKWPKGLKAKQKNNLKKKLKKAKMKVK